MAPGELQLGATGRPGAWSGAVKVAGRVVWTCPHQHRLRNVGRVTSRSAWECAALFGKLVRDPGHLEELRRRNQEGFGAAGGFVAGEEVATAEAMEPEALRVRALLAGPARLESAAG